MRFAIVLAAVLFAGFASSAENPAEQSLDDAATLLLLRRSWARALAEEEPLPAPQPTNEVAAQDSGGGSLLKFLLERHDASVPEVLEAECGHIREGHQQRDSCEDGRKDSLGLAMNFSYSPFAHCVVESVEEQIARNVAQSDWTPTFYDHLWNIGFRIVYPRSTYYYGGANTGGSDPGYRGKVCNRPFRDRAEEIRCECWTLYREALRELAEEEPPPVPQPTNEDDTQDSGGGSLLEFLLERHDTSVPEVLEVECGHIREGHPERNSCEDELKESIGLAMNFSYSPFAHCVVESVEERFARQVAQLPDWTPTFYSHLWSVRFRMIDPRGYYYWDGARSGYRGKVCELPFRNSAEEIRCECWTLYREALERWVSP